MFSDKFRFSKILVLLMILLGLILYAQIYGPRTIPGIKEFRENPRRFINQKIEFGGKIKKLEDERFLVEQLIDGERIVLDIKGTLKNAKLEDNIQGVFINKDGQGLVLNRYIISNLRPLKIAASLVALIFVLYILFHEFKFDFKTMILEEKNNF